MASDSLRSPRSCAAAASRRWSKTGESMATNERADDTQDDVRDDATAHGAPAEDAPADVGGDGARAPAELEAELDAARRSAADHWDALLRLRAEMDNLRKRTEREVENAHRFALERFMGELLPVCDSLEMGLAAASGEGTGMEGVREGIELTLKQLRSATEKFGLAEVDPLDQPFDPERHQAMTMQDAPGRESGTVVMVVQKGYTLNERLIRPAMVIVAR